MTESDLAGMHMRLDAVRCRRWWMLAIVASLVFGVAGHAWATPQGDLLNVNTASAGELQSLPGIGKVKAAAIVAYRSDNGPFTQVDDLVHVKGIGPKTLAKLRPLVTCGAKNGSKAKPGRGR